MLFFIYYQPPPLSDVVTTGGLFSSMSGFGAQPPPLSADATAVTENTESTNISVRNAFFMRITSLFVLYTEQEYHIIFTLSTNVGKFCCGFHYLHSSTNGNLPYDKIVKYTIVQINIMWDN